MRQNRETVQALKSRASIVNFANPPGTIPLNTQCFLRKLKNKIQDGQVCDLIR